MYYHLKKPLQIKYDFWKIIHSRLVEASRQWYNTVRQVLLSLVFKIPKADPSLFYYKNINELEGIITIHVDDFFSAGTAHFFKDIISKICEKFTVGKECNTAFRCLDLDLKEHTHYVKLLDTDNLKDEDICIHDTLRSTNGKLILISGQTRPDVGFDVCYIASNWKIQH